MLHFFCLCLNSPEIIEYVRFFYHSLLSVVCSCSVTVLDVAALIHIVRSGRAATFNDCIHMHLVPYLKIQISANDEMSKITLPSRHRIRNSSPGGLRPSTLPLSHGGSSASHNTYEWSLRVSGKESFVSLKPECQSGGRIRDLPTFQADRHITSRSFDNIPYTCSPVWARQNIIPTCFLYIEEGNHARWYQTFPIGIGMWWKQVVVIQDETSWC